MNHSRTIPHFHKYLKPGTLARIRDSRITARSNRLTKSLSQIPFRRSTPPPQPTNAVDALPLFANIYAPRCLRRKKLMPAKSIYFLTTPTTPVTESPDLITDAFGTDIIVAN